jgi:leader peptidase (prepilin peptidase)/N-methyltransferase
MILLLVQLPLYYFPAYFIFFSALLVTIRSDFETLLISRFATLFLIPLGIGFAFFNLLPINVLESVTAACIGYVFLYAIAKTFYYVTGKQGIGEGDFELLAFIGSFTGFLGLWATLLVSSIMGTFFGLLYMLVTGSDRSLKIPYGPFLAFGAIIFVLWQQAFVQLIY